jgi:uncharacterized protein (DUF433 family)
MFPAASIAGYSRIQLTGLIHLGGQRIAMKELNRITLDPGVMGGKACIRGLRVTVGVVVGLLASGRSRDEILKAYPYSEPDDIDQALTYAAWRVEEREVPLLTGAE